MIYTTICILSILKCLEHLNVFFHMIYIHIMYIHILYKSVNHDEYYISYYYTIPFYCVALIKYQYCLHECILCHHVIICVMNLHIPKPHPSIAMNCST